MMRHVPKLPDNIDVPKFIKQISTDNVKACYTIFSSNMGLV